MKAQWKRAHLRAAFEYAACSQAQRLKVGCVIVKNDAVISIGINGTYVGCKTNCCEIERADGSLETSPDVIHAEANALDKLSRSHESSEGAHLFVTQSPCAPCARRIINTGIRHVYFANPYRDPEGINLLKDAGVVVEQVCID